MHVSVRTRCTFGYGVNSVRGSYFYRSRCGVDEGGGGNKRGKKEEKRFRIALCICEVCIGVRGKKRAGQANFINIGLHWDPETMREQHRYDKLESRAVCTRTLCRSFGLALFLFL